jgi:hypothetical protein
MTMRMIGLAAAVSVLAVMAGQAAADPISVAATDSIYGAAAGGGGATDPVSITLGGGTTDVTFSASGSITLNAGTYNDPDGVGAATTTSYNSGAGNLSGITLQGAGALVGVFIGTTTPTATALDFTSGGMGTAFTSLSPTLDQVFFIGDGLTGDGTGSTQTFYVPSGATTLELGISDACGYNGGPGCYSDNSGTYSVAVNQVGNAPAVPEPATMTVLGSGLLGLLVARRRRPQQA